MNGLGPAALQQEHVRPKMFAFVEGERGLQLVFYMKIIKYFCHPDLGTKKE